MVERIGAFGGSFNPVHFGHLRTAEEIRARLSLSKILFIPTYEPPHKQTAALSYNHRKSMTALAIMDNPFFVLENIEEKLPVPSYTYRTMQALIKLYGADTEFYFIMGEDDFSNINTWHSPSLLFSLCNIIVVTRHNKESLPADLVPVDLKDEFWYKENERVLMHKGGRKVYLLQIPILDISSSRIRELVQKNQSINYLTPGPVIDYIKKENLYH